MKYLIYINTKQHSGRCFRPVEVDGYRQTISAEAFRGLMLDAGYKYSQKFMTGKVYEAVYSIYHSFDFDMNKDQFGFTIEGDPINLYDFYKEIGYDRKTKRIKGKTIYQIIRDYLKGLDHEKKPISNH